MKRLYLIRHPETSFLANDPGRRHPNDASLSMRGRMQASEITRRLQNESIDLVLTSLYRRAQETANILNEAWRAPLFSSYALNEYFLREDGSGVETTEQAISRSFGYLNSFRADFDGIAIVSHNGILTTLLSALLNTSFKKRQGPFKDLGALVALRNDWELGDSGWNIVERFVPVV